MKKPIPVTILTWFLWSGKTTLLNNILKNKKGYKIAVIENEYWEESIDSELIKQDVTQLIEISDWCMCCVVRGDLIAWVEEILNSGNDIDYIVIEASWMSEPMPVAETFIMENFDGRTKLDWIVCVVDAQNFHHKIVQSLQTTYEQIESSHFIILNKVEWLSKEKLDEIKLAIRKINAHAAIIQSDYCDVDINAVLDTELCDVENYEKKEEHHHNDKHSHDHEHSHNHEHEHNHDKHSDKHSHHEHSHHEHSHHEHSHAHDKKQIDSYFFKTEVPCFHVENIKHFLGEISDDIFRMKWFVCFKDFPNERYILQKAGACFTLVKDEDWSEESTESKFVFIWKNIDQQKIYDTLLKDVFFD